MSKRDRQEAVAKEIAQYGTPDGDPKRREVPGTRQGPENTGAMEIDTASTLGPGGGRGGGFSFMVHHPWQACARTPSRIAGFRIAHLGTVATWSITIPKRGVRKRRRRE